MRKRVTYTADDLRPVKHPETLTPLIGTRRGHLTITDIAGANIYGAEYMFVNCDCGKTDYLFSVRSLRKSDHLSCGCTQMRSKMPEFGIWKGMRSRCSNSRCKDYKFYGARGIRVCEQWDKSFDAFYRDVGPRPTPVHSLDRIDHEKDYCPENVRWATVLEQRNNTSRTVHVTYEGKEWPISLLAEHLGLNKQRLYFRYMYWRDINIAIEKAKQYKSRSAPNKEGTGSPERRAWVAIKSRCHNPDDKAWHHYGGRGIYVCEEWRASYDRFLADVGPRPAPGYSLDRLDNDGPYSKENCAWRTQSDQMNNTRSTRMVEFEGKKQPLTPLCKRFGMPIGLVRLRLFKYKWTVERALTEPNNMLAARAKRTSKDTN